MHMVKHKPTKTAQHLNEGESVYLHVGVVLAAAQAELYAGYEMVHVGGQGARQHHDQLSQEGETA